MNDEEAERRFLEGMERRARADCQTGARDIRSRLNNFLLDEDNRRLLTFAELKVLGATSDVLAEIETRLMS
jgi:hypothetical protein